MKRSVFFVAKMDCPSEEQVIRLSLDGTVGIRNIEVDLSSRTVAITHEGPVDRITARLRPLNLGEELRESMDAVQKPGDRRHGDRTVLIAVLAINAGFFLAELIFGVIASSMGLIADSLDMLADAFVYGISLYAVGGSATRKKGVAALSGYIQLLLAVLGFVEVARRVFGADAVPDAGMMIGVSLFALAGNAVCLVLLQRSRNREAHIQASMIFTSNDVIANAGVIVAAVLVSVWKSPLPDLAVGVAVFLLVTRGAFRILKLSRQ